MSSDRLILALAVLDGDREARKILADLLEEEGDRGLAPWARRCKGSRRGRLDLAIMLLPSETAVALAGNQFLPHGFEDITAWANLAAFGGLFGQWLAETMPRAPFEEWRRQVERLIPPLDLDWRRRGWPAASRQLALHRAQERLLDAMACVHEVRLAGPDGNVKTRHWSLQANQHVREVAASSAATTELIDWQIGAVRLAYQALLGAG